MFRCGTFRVNGNEQKGTPEPDQDSKAHDKLDLKNVVPPIQESLRALDRQGSPLFDTHSPLPKLKKPNKPDCHPRLPCQAPFGIDVVTW